MKRISTLQMTAKDLQKLHPILQDASQVEMSGHGSASNKATSVWAGASPPSQVAKEGGNSTSGPHGVAHSAVASELDA